MKYEKTIEQIKSGTLTRDALRTIRERATGALANGDEDARSVLQALDHAVARDWRIVFMGFCPNGELANRVDGRWRAEGTCTFDYDESEAQMNQFRSIIAGDLVVLKKSEVHGKPMSLHGHGRVTGTRTGADGRRELLVDWSQAVPFPEHVPMMGCQGTVNLREMGTVEGAMPMAFFDWAGLPRPRWLVGLLTRSPPRTLHATPWWHRPQAKQVVGAASVAG